ncbi:iron ABC transporter substrate-binding protein [Ancylobacter sp. WKF20]|uniref:iron ABC transporter substrate-binding protein n=1 Tax=Ancylobacter sp. WKF20 TaxID=3039801 RepID=UPI002434622C|nr:iron ABC transporter substrate-binding protein [Ancylobacter sp. WKF20]WGD32014.1 iron ABC transporter substrate-binding protein [Ancylobacter sp. WKF20]
MSIKSAAGTKIYIGTTTAATNETQFAADTYVEVKEVEDLGELGDESEAISFAALGDARVKKLKGARDAGTLVLVVGRDPLDPGQIAMRSAEKNTFEYNFKVVANDAPDADHTNSIYYFRGLVMSARDNYGQQNNVVRTTFNIGINSAILELPAEEEA